jgi:FkbH-like protein
MMSTATSPHGNLPTSRASTLTKTVLLLADTVIDPLSRVFEASAEEPRLRGVAAPYGQVYQVLMDPKHAAWEAAPDYLLVWTTPGLTLPSFRSALAFEGMDVDAILGEVETFADLIVRGAANVGVTLVTTWTLAPHQRWIQALAWKDRVGIANVLARANLLLAERLAPYANIVLLDAAYWQNTVGPGAYDPRMYAIGKILYSYPLFEKAGAEVKAVIRGLSGLGKKVIVCDLDNTMWGGVAADDEIQNIKLGSPDPVGECFVEFQRSLKALKARGILLAICSKNDETFARSVIAEHPSMILREADFVAWRINWVDKATNLAILAEELNLGLDSLVFLDDSLEERDQVRRLLPQVYVPDLPASPTEYARFVESLTCFEAANLSVEDYARTTMYQAEHGRRLSQEVAGGIEEWLRSLELRVSASRLTKKSLPRAAQLLNKTNQFNLSVRRMDEQTFWQWSQEPGHSVYVFNVSDKFGDFGLTAIASLACSGSVGQIVDFVMSCRVMGKTVEAAILAYIVGEASRMGVGALSAPPTPTTRNAPAVTFFQAQYADPSLSRIDPAHIQPPVGIVCMEDK